MLIGRQFDINCTDVFRELVGRPSTDVGDTGEPILLNEPAERHLSENYVQFIGDGSDLI